MAFLAGKQLKMDNKDVAGLFVVLAIFMMAMLMVLLEHFYLGQCKSKICGQALLLCHYRTAFGRKEITNCSQIG